MRIEDSVRRFIVEELGWSGTDELTDEYRLIGTGVLDSIGVVHVMTFLEGEYGIRLFDEVVDFGQFGSLESIARLVVAMRSTQHAPAASNAEKETA
jgi:acyl carrier protein